MSTSLFVDAEAPPPIEPVLAAIDRDRDLALADGELAALRAWPDSALFYRRGRSSRGVQVTFDGARFAIRLLVLSTRDDYELAFRFAEVLGGEGDVEVEAGDTIAARELRAKLADEWMVRDMAVGVTAIRASLAQGGTVKISGPVRALEISPAAIATDALELIDTLRRAQIEDAAPTPAPAPDPERALDDAHLEALRAEEEALPKRPPERAGWSTIVGFLSALLVLGPPALIIRLLTWPVRGRLRDRVRARRDRRVARQRARADEERAKLTVKVDDLDRRVDRAVWTFAGGNAVRADRELSAVVHERETHALAWHNLSVTRARLRLPRLSAAAAERATALGHVARRPSWLRERAWLYALMFVAMAGLAPD